MKIALIGYGKMGREIESAAKERGHEIVLKARRNEADLLSAAHLGKADVAIEFTAPSAAPSNIRACFDAKVPVVVGTTGWYAHFPEVKEHCEKTNGTLFHATNFSLGVNIFFKVNRYLATLMDAYPQYDVSLEEIHHVHKLDKPSGTAITLASQVLEAISRKKQWTLGEGGADDLVIHDRREGEVPGTHIIRYTSGIDDIEIMHKAHNRKGFALGAVMAAEFIIGKKGIFTMDDLV